MQPTPDQSSSHIVADPVGDLEMLVDMPRLDLQANPPCVAIVCHPHPLFGGTMPNKVAHILARACNDSGAVAVRFNFRGVGRSAGTHDDGPGEIDDVLAVIGWAQQRWPNAPVWLAGFSFGAAMALQAALRHGRIARLITIAPALHWLQSIKD